MDCIVHGVTMSQTRQSDLHFHFHLVFGISIISRLMAIVDRQMNELMNEDFGYEITTLMDRKIFSIREKEEVWYQNRNKMYVYVSAHVCVCVCVCVCGWLVEEGVVQVHDSLL